MTDDSKAFESHCACLRVEYDPVDNGDGSKSERWRCALCRSQFIRQARADAALRSLRDDPALADHALANEYARQATEAEAELATERAKVADLEQRCGEQKVQLDYAHAGQLGDAEELDDLRATLAKVEAERDAWKESASMACERAADDCTCAGCRYAAEVHAPKGTTGT
jgi:hypothetical protein